MTGLRENCGKKETQLQGIKGSHKWLNSNKTLTSPWPTARLLCACKNNHYVAALALPQQIAMDFLNVVIKNNSKFWLLVKYSSCYSCQSWSLSLAAVKLSTYFSVRVSSSMLWRWCDPVMSHEITVLSCLLLKLQRGQLLSQVIVVCSIRLMSKCLCCIRSQ